MPHCMIALTSQNSQDFESPGQNMALHRCSHPHAEQSVPCQLIVKVSTRKRFVQGPCESTGALAQSALRHDRDDIEASGATRHASRRGGPIAAAHSMCINLVHLTALRTTIRTARDDAGARASRVHATATRLRLRIA